MRLTLRTLLAYLDDTLPPDQAKAIGQKVAESETAGELIDRIKKVTRRRGLSTPSKTEGGGPSDPNVVADYLSDALSADQVAQFEKICLESDVHLAEVAACHQILTLLLSEPVRVPPTARQRMYQLVRGKESIPGRKPGLTVPVAGELPESPAAEADDADAAYLLGMRAYSRNEPWRTRAVPVLAAAALLVCLAAAVWLAFPAPGRGRETAETGVPVVPVAAANEKLPAVIPPGAEPPLAPAPRPVDDKKDAKETKPAEKPGELVPAAATPKADRVVVGKVETADAVVVSRTGADGKWLRATVNEPDLYTTDRVVCLPGYKAKVRIDRALEIELWGNVPEQRPEISLLESAVTFHAPTDGFDADMTVHAGRVYFVATRPAGAKVRLRFRDEVWDLTIPDDKAEVVAEVLNNLVPGGLRDLDASELPVTVVGLAVTKGTAGLKVRYKALPEIKTNEWVTWSSKGPGPDGPRPIDSTQTKGTVRYFSRYELPVGEQAKAAQQALTELSKRAADRDSIKVALAELLRDDDQTYTLPRMVGARLGVLAEAALGDLPPVIDSLNDGNRPFVRDAATYALAASLAATPDGVEAFRKRLVEKLSFTDEQTALAVRLLRGFTEQERRSPEATELVLAPLAGNILVIRELAFWTARALIDPDVPPSRAMMMFNSAAPQDLRDPAVKAWRKYLTEEVKAKPTPTKGPEPKK